MFDRRVGSLCFTPYTNSDRKWRKNQLMSKQAIALAKRVDSKIFILRTESYSRRRSGRALRRAGKRLNQQVNRNADRFPRDFIFRLSVTEYENLRLQFATSSFGHGGRRSLPYAFTEQGAIMAATILNSERAIPMSIFVVRAFVRMPRSAGGQSADRRQAE